jgi:arsenate reductase
MILYGIKNCDTVKKACRWLEANDVPFTFHDFRKDGLEQTTIETWLQRVSWEILLNKRGTTWRKLDDSLKEQLNESIAVELMLANPTLIKRPVVTINDDCLVGFKETEYAAYFGR